MNRPLAAARAGLARGGIELKNSLQDRQDLMGYLWPTVLLLGVLVFTRNVTVPGTDLSLSTRTLPSLLGMNMVFGGMMGIAGQLVIEREDGTLLRAKATPDGMTGYLIGKIVQVTGMTCVILMGLLVIPGVFLVDGLEPHWLTIGWVLLLGMVATMPIGAVLGSLIEKPANFTFVMLPLTGLIAISGIFYPVSSFPGWLQGLAQVFPVYWLGLGMRAGLLPDGLAAAEMGGTWRHLETAGVLSAWAVAGLLLAPVVLRRMARRESGSAVAARREKAMQRVA
jgi:ABC-2 type transport system permease protein